MKNVVLTSLLLIFFALISISSVTAQDNEWVNQVIVVNSGKFESSAPFLDYVTVQSYNPASQATTVFGTIYTQSAQDVVIKGNMAYVAAQDSIIMYNLDNYQRVAAISDSGLSKLCIYNNKLIVTKGWPVTRFFVEVLDASNLALLARVQNISGDCGGATFDKDTVYVAVNQGYAGTEGKIACIATDTWTVAREVNFGTSAVGIWNLYNYNGNLFTINRTPYGATLTGSITVYNLFTRTFQNKIFEANIGDGCGIRSNLLYLKYSNGIASFNMDNLTIENTHVVDPPMQAGVYINSGAIDYIEGKLYLQLGNRPPTFGIGIVASSTTGDSLTSYPTGINAESVAIDYRTPVGIQPASNKGVSFSVYPNPASEMVTVSVNQPASHVAVMDITGRVVYSNSEVSSNILRIDCSKFPAGIYFVSITTQNGKTAGKFIKQ
jgi:hypothetical protein